MKKILLVDDSTTIRNVLKASMHTSYEILEAENGETALHIANEQNIDFFLLDVNMPVMDGISLTKKIREMPQYGNTPIVILTTETRSEKRKAAQDAGANGWVVKPCDPDKLLNVIQKLV